MATPNRGSHTEVLTAENATALAAWTRSPSGAFVLRSSQKAVGTLEAVENGGLLIRLFNGPRSS